MSDIKPTKTPARGQVSPFDLVDTHPENDVVPDPAQDGIKLELDKALKDTFPASDPVSVSQPITTGPTTDASEAADMKNVNYGKQAKTEDTESKARVPRQNGEPDAE